MNKFKVGDRVRITRTSFPSNCPIGYISTVLEVREDGYRLSGNGTNHKPDGWFFTFYENLELVENVNQEIEVGDIVEIIAEDYEVGEQAKVEQLVSQHHPDRVKVKHIRKGILGSETTDYLLTSLKLVCKANKQEIVGYELLKDLPGIPAGTKSSYISEDKTYINFKGSKQLGDTDFDFAGNYLKDTTWFKPIYKTKEVVVKISGNREVKFTDRGIFLSDKEGVSFDQFKNIRAFFTEKRTTNTWVMNYPLVVTQIKVGCQLVNSEDVELIYQAIQNLK